MVWRVRKYLTSNGRLRTFPQFFDHPERVQELLRFWEEMGAGAKPRAEPEPD